MFTKGDAIAIDMPMTHAAVTIYLAIVLGGYNVVSIAESFAAKEIATRMRISNAKGIFTQDFIVRGWKKLPLYKEKMAAATDPNSPDPDNPVSPNLQLAQFAAGCFWGVELAFQRFHGVVLTKVGYTQGHLPNPTYERVYNDDTGHVEAFGFHFDPKVCSYEDLLMVFWEKHDPTTLNRQGEDVGTRYRSGIYYYDDAQEKAAKESLETKQQEVDESKVVTEIFAAERFYQVEKLHQQYLENGGGYGNKQSAAKGCTDPIRCYG